MYLGNTFGSIWEDSGPTDDREEPFHIDQLPPIATDDKAQHEREIILIAAKENLTSAELSEMKKLTTLKMSFYHTYNPNSPIYRHHWLTYFIEGIEDKKKKAQKTPAPTAPKKTPKRKKGPVKDKTERQWKKQKTNEQGNEALNI